MRLQLWRENRIQGGVVLCLSLRIHYDATYFVDEPHIYAQQPPHYRTTAHPGYEECWWDTTPQAVLNCVAEVLKPVEGEGHLWGSLFYGHRGVQQLVRRAQQRWLEECP